RRRRSGSTRRSGSPSTGGDRPCRRHGTTTSSVRSPPTPADRLRAVIAAAATFVEGSAALAAALAAAAVLVLREPRSRALAMPVALLLALGAVALISGSSISDDVSGRLGLLGAAGLVGLVLLVVLTVAFVRRPGWFVIAVVLTLPFRIPVPTGADDTANLLLPLYGVLAAGVLAHLWRVFRVGEEAPREDA